MSRGDLTDEQWERLRPPPMGITYVFAGLVVANRNQAAAWYERLLGRPPDFLPNDAEAVWQVAGTARFTSWRTRIGLVEAS